MVCEKWVQRRLIFRMDLTHCDMPMVVSTILYPLAIEAAQYNILYPLIKIRSTTLLHCWLFWIPFKCLFDASFNHLSHRSILLFICERFVTDDGLINFHLSLRIELDLTSLFKNWVRHKVLRRYVDVCKLIEDHVKLGRAFANLKDA